MYIGYDADDIMMPYRIPSDEVLSDAIRAVIGRDLLVRSQTTMTELVMSELNNGSDEYKVSGERIRRISIERDLLRIEIEYNQHDDRSSPDVCPVCGFPMASVNNTTLAGGNTKVGRRCTRCPYHTGAKRRSPGRYTFSRGQLSKSGMSQGERISLIMDASDLMKKAAAMVESATRGTEYVRKGKSCANNIKRMTISKKNANSLENLVADMNGGNDGNNSSPEPVRNAKLKNI